MSEIKNIDPMDHYSQPLKVDATLLAKRYTFESRDNPEKPGRSLRVLFDSRFEFIEGFNPEYIYSVTFETAGNEAGNHYHEVKNEIFYPLAGQFEIQLEDVESKEKETLSLTSENHEAIFVKTGIAHKVVAKSDGAVLLVVASAPNIESDEFKYKPTS